MNAADISPKVSVVIPTHNRAPLLPRAIRSVLAQDYRDFEVIIVDDASTDATTEIVKNFKNACIRYVRFESHQGAPAARNAGARAAQGLFISFLDSDDEWLPGKLKNETAFLTMHPDYLLCISGIVVIDERNRHIIYRTPRRPYTITQDVAVRQNDFFTNDFTVRTAVFNRLGGFDEMFLARQDNDLWIRITALGPGRYLAGQGMRKFSGRRDQISTHLDTRLAATHALFEKHKALFTKDPVAHTIIITCIGTLYLLKDDEQAKAYFAQALSLSPGIIDRMKLCAVLLVFTLCKRRGFAIVKFLYRLLRPANYFFMSEFASSHTAPALFKNRGL